MKGLSVLPRRLRQPLERVPSYVWYILGLFVLTRVVLTLIGFAAWRYIGTVTPESINGPWQFSHTTAFLLHSSPFLAVWGHWDSGWYLKIAHNWYTYQTASVDRYGLVFFPLFPALVRAFGVVLRDYFITGLLINNIALIVSAIYLYRFCAERWRNDVGRRAVKYLLIFPTSFYLSGFLSEPLFIMLSIVAFYYAYRRQWNVAGIAAGLMAISRPIGILIAVPLLYLYVREHWHEAWREKLRNGVHLLWIPIAFLAFLVLQRHLTGQWFVLAKLENLGWGRHISSPIHIVRQGFASFTNMFLLAMGLLPWLLMWLGRKSLDRALILWGVIIMLPALLTELAGLPRYASVVFPMYIVLALGSKSKAVDESLTIASALGLGVLMLLWTLNIPFLQ